MKQTRVQHHQVPVVSFEHEGILNVVSQRYIPRYSVIESKFASRDVAGRIGESRDRKVDYKSVRRGHLVGEEQRCVQCIGT
jgi:hypothetical protein